ncbi:tubulin-specific chaperone A-like [Gigantopelta aegis]|uniref:tubulin-specific chaperone A-like n=1 Tax=Gigantopelta aegis TaxID=1735272 RepID=UPI001B8877CD|nr:tubulin-specific chaperone A-like [Gigantopelta aegis]
MAAADPRIRNIKIKTGVVKRLTKEKSMYEQEAKQFAEKVEKMKADKKDEYDIRKQTEVAEESKMMIPDTLRRLGSATNELENILKQEDDLAETEEYKAARECLVLANNAIA